MTSPTWGAARGAHASGIVFGLVLKSAPLGRRLRQLFAESSWRTVEPSLASGVSDCDVLVVDIDRLREVRQPVPTLAVASAPEPVDIGETAAELRALVDRDESDEAFRTAAHEILAGYGLISPTLTPMLLDQVRTTPRSAPPAPMAELTEREVEVATLVTRGMSNGEIAGELHVAESTVKFHMTNILHKSGCRDRSQLVARHSAQLPPSA